MAGSSSYPSASDFRMEIDRRNVTAVVRLIGSANMNACDGLQEKLVELVDQPNARLVLDLSHLDFICSLGLGALIAAHLRCRHQQGSVRLVAPTPAIQDLLKVTKLNLLFPEYPSIDAALTEKA